jgi:glycosyltransferase involved in cell wall biosynthesis
MIIVSSAIPPDHSGAGKLIFGFYQYLKKTDQNVQLITHTKVRNDKSIISIRKFSNIEWVRKPALIVDFIYSFIYLLIRFGLFERKKRHKKTVWIVSSNPLNFAATLAFHFLGNKIILQNSLLGSDDPEYRYPGDFFSLKFKMKRLQYKLADAITCVSPALFELSKKHHPNCFFIPNPVDLNTFKQKQNTKKERPQNVLFVGAIGFRKGVDIVFRTIDLVHKKHPDISFTFVGPDKLDPKLKTLFEGLKHIRKEKVHIVGFKENPASFFQDADIFFLPSRREGFGIVFLEAMASGLPVVAKRLEGITDYIFGNDYHTILDTEDPSQYAQTIFKLLADNTFYNKLSLKGLSLVKRFEEKKIYLQYIQLTKQLNQYTPK